MTGRSGLTVPFQVATVAIVLFIYANFDHDRPTAVWLTWATAVAVGLLIFDHRRNRLGYLSPGSLVAVAALLFFVVRPYAVLSSGEFSPGAEADTRVLDVVSYASFCQAETICVTFLALSAWTARLMQLRVNSAGRVMSVASIHVGKPVRVDRAVRYTYIGVAIALISDLYLIRSSGGLGAYFAGLATRSSSLAGKSYATFGYLPLLIALVTLLACRKPSTIPKFRPTVAIAVTSLIVTALVTGGRAQLIFGAALPLLLIKQWSPKPFRSRTLVVLGTSLAVIAVVYGLIVRQNTFSHGQTLQQLKANPIETVVSSATNGLELRPFDSVMRLSEASLRHEYTNQSGATYVDAFAWFVPRAFWANKPFGGGNTWFTETLVPRFYFPDRVETSLSAPGEGFANFGWPGVVVAAAFFGTLLGVLERRTRSDRGSAPVTLAVLSPLMVSLLRGDAYHNLPLIGLSAVLCFALSRRCGLSGAIPRRRSSPQSRGELSYIAG